MAKYLELNVKWSISGGIECGGEANSATSDPGVGKCSFALIFQLRAVSKEPAAASPPTIFFLFLLAAQLIDWIMINRVEDNGQWACGRVGGKSSGCLMDKTGPESPTQISRPAFY